MRPKILYSLFQPLTQIKGIGPKNAALLEGLCGNHLLDLLVHSPSSYIDRRNNPKIKDLKEDSIVTLTITVDRHAPSFNKRMPYRINCSDETGIISIVYFNAKPIYLKKLLPINSRKVISGKVEAYNDIFQMAHPKYVVDIGELDNVKQIECVYPLTAGITSRILRNSISSTLSVSPALPEWIPEAIMKKNNWTGWKDSLENLHKPKQIYTNKIDNNYLSRLAFDELLSHQLKLRLVRNKLTLIKGNSLKATNKLIDRLIDSLDFELTLDQNKSIKEISNNIASEYKMLRLLQGDVGSGKTIVALFALLQVIENSKRGILMAPTELLAQQHYETIKSFLKKLDVSISLITGSIKDNRNYDADLIIGTHALFQSDSHFKDVGLLIIDEQHKFGVHQRILLSEKAGDECDTLLMTATPIPRTLELAAYGDMDISKLVTMPLNRKPILTKSMSNDKVDNLKAALLKKIKNDEKIYWVCPLVDESDFNSIQSVTARLKNLEKFYGKNTVGMVHGKMKNDEKNMIMQEFKNGNLKILIATSVIEVGIDVPEATVIIIENCERFGLSQLHQLRGRVGRGTKESTCILVFQKPLTDSAKQRIKIMKETNDGFKIAEEDLKIRGSGETLGVKQSGLPDFRLSDLSIHQNILEQARDLSIEIIKNDPMLKTDIGKAQRALLHLFRNEVAIDYIKSG
jgi:ATP-dependent DNA helicase RecG